MCSSDSSMYFLWFDGFFSFIHCQKTFHYMDVPPIFYSSNYWRTSYFCHCWMIINNSYAGFMHLHSNANNSSKWSFKCFYQFMVLVAFTTGKKILTVTLNLFIFTDVWVTLCPVISVIYGFKESFWFSICLAFSCCKYKTVDFHVSPWWDWNKKFSLLFMYLSKLSIL